MSINIKYIKQAAHLQWEGYLALLTGLLTSPELPRRLMVWVRSRSVKMGSSRTVGWRGCWLEKCISGSEDTELIILESSRPSEGPFAGWEGGALVIGGGVGRDCPDMMSFIVKGISSRGGSLLGITPNSFWSSFFMAELPIIIVGLFEEFRKLLCISFCPSLGPLFSTTSSMVKATNCQRVGFSCQV